MKKNNIGLIALLGIGGWLLFSSFKKKKTSGQVYVDQLNVPTGTKEVYSNVGTIVYDQNMQKIFTYDTANIGMAVTGTKDNVMYSVVIGDDFQNGIGGFVFYNDVQSI